MADEIAEELLAKSGKAKEKGGSGRPYAEYTVRRAAEIIAKRRPR